MPHPHRSYLGPRRNQRDPWPVHHKLHNVKETTVYFYRCTEQQLGEHLTRIHEAGDTLHRAVYKGGRDWVLICVKDGDGQQALVAELRALREEIAAAREQVQTLMMAAGPIRAARV